MKKVAILVTDGFEEVELTSPQKAMDDAGISYHIVSPNENTVKAWADGNWSKEYQVDKKLSDAKVGDYNALLLPGGVINPDRLRRNEDAVTFVRSFFEQHKPVSAICHGPQTLIDADVVRGRRMTSFHSIKQDLINAGAEWVDEEVVVDEGFTTSRSPEDLEAFNAKLVEEVMEGKHEDQHA